MCQLPAGLLQHRHEHIGQAGIWGIVTFGNRVPLPAAPSQSLQLGMLPSLFPTL